MKNAHLIDEGDVCDANDGFVRVFVEVESTLFQPFKIRWLFDVQTTLREKKFIFIIITCYWLQQL